MTAPPPIPNNPARIPVTIPATITAAASQASSPTGTPSHMFPHRPSGGRDGERGDVGGQERERVGNHRDACPGPRRMGCDMPPERARAGHAVEEPEHVT